MFCRITNQYIGCSDIVLPKNLVLFQYVTSLDCVHEKFKQKLPSEERGDLKITGKDLEG